MQNQRKGFITPLLLAFIALLLIGGGAYIVVNQLNYPESPGRPVAVIPAQATQAAPTSNPQPAGWKTYTSDLTGIQVKYPPKYYVVHTLGNPDSDTFTSITDLGKEDDRNLWGLARGGSPAHIQIIYHANRRNLSISDLAKEWATSAGVTSSCTSLIVSGESALRCSLFVEGEGGLYSDMIFLKHASATYSLAANSPEPDDVVHSDLSEMLSFIRFTSSNTPISVAVPGMSKYTDSDFGFSFWYPTGWTVQKAAVSKPDSFPGGTVSKVLNIIPNGSNNQKLTIEEFFSPSMSISDSASYCTMGANQGGGCGSIRFYFDASTHTWMRESPASVAYSSKDGTSYTIAATTQVADVSQNTMGGLHMLAGDDLHHKDIIVPLSAHNFVVVDGLSTSNSVFARTIVATDPNVATPVSVAEQIKTIQAEASAYGI